MPGDHLITYEIDETGCLHGIYSDIVDLFSIGRVVNVRDASRIEFNEENQIWEVIDASDGQVVHCDKNRARAIEWEIVHFGPGGPLYKGDRST
jgi:hypothetical protein